MTIEKRIGWLKIGAAITMGFGVLIAAAAIPALQAPARFLLDFIYFPLDGAQETNIEAARLLSAITGGVLFGWGLLLGMIGTKVLPDNPMLARSLIMTSIITWFVIDSSMSVAAGAPLNVVGNLGFLAVFVLPVWGLKEEG